MLKGMVQSYGANAAQTLTAGALHREAGADSSQHGGAR
jgi:hypothetical protein